MKRSNIFGLAFLVAVFVQSFPAHSKQVDACIQQNNPERAIAACTELLKDKTQTREQLAALYQLRGVAYDNDRRYEKAIADYSRAIRIKPNDEAYYNRGETNFKLRQYKKAISDFTRAIRFNRKMTMAYFNRGTSYFHLRRYRKAIRDYSRSIRLNPEYAPAYQNRAVAYKLSGKKRKAASDYRKYLELE